MKLGQNVTHVAQVADDDRPLDGEAVDREGDEEEAGEDEADVDGGQGVGAQAVVGVQRALQGRDAGEGHEEQEEADAHGEHVLPYRARLALDIVSAYYWQ